MSLLLLSGGAGAAPPSTLLPSSYLLQIAFASNPRDASPVWTDVSSYLLGGRTSRGRQRELERTQPGTAQFILDNNDRRFEPTNTGSPYSPNVLPLKPVRFSVVYNGLTYPIWTGFVERWAVDWQSPNESTITLDCVDAFELLNLWQLNRPLPSVTFGSAVFTLNPSFSAGPISIATSGKNPADSAIRCVFDTKVSPIALTIILGTDATKTPISTWADVVGAVQASNFASQYVTASLVPGDDGNSLATITSGTIPTGGYAQQTAGPRISGVLSDIGWNAGTSLDAGLSQLQRFYPAPADQVNALQHIQDVVDTELGYVFVGANGAMIFQGRNYRQLQTLSSATFGDADGEIPYETIEPMLDRDEVWNEARVARSAGTVIYDRKGRPISTVYTTQTYVDAASQTAYGPRVISKSGTLHVTDAAAAGMAQYLVRQYKDPQINIRQIKVEPLNSYAIWNAILKLGISNRVTLKRRPPEHPAVGNPVFSKDVFIESVAHEFQPTVYWATTYGLSPPNPNYYAYT